MGPLLQNVAAILIAVAAAAWLVRRGIRTGRPRGCHGAPTSGPDGFVPAESLTMPRRRG